ncbi:MAG: phosphate ABC transporter substrate-binding protein [Chlamydiae bacterium]|nr:phosphate ABC transporter substrate-binding protein [Chlamydiota bacterium]MBI3266449.1 phosphate ABC transporter substrate-binding protein [Chlamydiota bacterium]
MKKFWVFAISLFCGTTLFAGEKMIQVKGSDTMVNLGQAWAEAFMEVHPDSAIAVTGGGSGTGIAALINGTCDIAESSRNMKPEEIAQAKQNGHDVKEFVVGLDALTVVVHPDNPVSQLNIDQLSGIFSGKIKNWKEVGGPDREIVALSRERNSGTHIFFLEHVVRRGNEKGPEEFDPAILMLPSSQTIAEEVSHNPEAIGYFGLGYLTQDEKAIAVSKNPEGPFIMPSVETASKGEYPISRPLLMYTGGVPQGNVKVFIDFAKSSQGQEIVKQMDFVPLKK